MSGGMYVSKYSRRYARHTTTANRRAPLWCVLVIALGLLLIAAATAAFAAVVLHGRGTLQAPAVQESTLQVSDVRLTRPLLPGATADLLFSVRNPNLFSVRVDQVAVIGALRKAKPAGCASKVAGPVTGKTGYRLPRAEQVLVAAGVKKNVLVRAAFTLARSAKTGCGFTAEVDVSATQLAPTTSPTVGHPTSASTSAPPPTQTTTGTPAGSTPATTDPVPTGPVSPPPTLPGDCDMLDPSCVIPPGLGT